MGWYFILTCVVVLAYAIACIRDIVGDTEMDIGGPKHLQLGGRPRSKPVAGSDA